MSSEPDDPTLSSHGAGDSLSTLDHAKVRGEFEDRVRRVNDPSVCERLLPRDEAGDYLNKTVQLWWEGFLDRAESDHDRSKPDVERTEAAPSFIQVGEVRSAGVRSFGLETPPALAWTSSGPLPKIGDKIYLIRDAAAVSDCNRSDPADPPSLDLDSASTAEVAIDDVRLAHRILLEMGFAFPSTQVPEADPRVVQIAQILSFRVGVSSAADIQEAELRAEFEDWAPTDSWMQRACRQPDWRRWLHHRHVYDSAMVQTAWVAYRAGAQRKHSTPEPMSLAERPAARPEPKEFISRESWYESLQNLARSHGNLGAVRDFEGWTSRWDFESPEEAYYGEFPEHRKDGANE